MIRKQHLLLACLLIASISLIGNGVYIKAKAKVAGWMIANTWETRPKDGVPQKPWPWADTHVVARIHIPRLGISQYVMQDASGESLAFGPGAVLPLKESRYHFIAGHRDTHFHYLDKLILGDTVEVEIYDGHQYQYQITQTNVVDTRQGAFSIDEQSKGISLMTCWPMDSLVPGGPLRYVVSGESI
jgi:sortase A